MLEHLLISLFPLALATASVMDLLNFTIPNRISLGLLAGFLVAVPVFSMSWPMVLNHLGAGFLLLLISFAIFACGWIGGGDAKLMAATALWLGFDHLLPFLLWTAILGGGLALLVLTYRHVLPPVWLLGQSWALRLHDPKQGIPYGIAIAAAGLVVYPNTIWMTGIAG